MAKRLFDFIAAFASLMILSPVFVLLALMIKSDSPGPVFYRQERVGKNGKLFGLWKFRTMHTGADKLQAITVGRRDPRITRVGFFLRRLKLDEFPQLVNVLAGEMSFVGPRPELKKFVDLYNAEQMLIIAIRPGITDYASLEFRKENEILEGKHDPIGFYISEIMPLKLALNLKYIREQSFWLDMKIIFQTSLHIWKK